MANKARRLAVLVATGAMLAAPRRAAAIDRAAPVAEQDVAPVTAVHTRHLRSHSAAILAIIQRASEHSETFRHLVNIINASNGIVYVEEGQCTHNVRACLVTITPAGAEYRILNVRVDTAKADWDLAGSIGHELSHATEVLSDRFVTTTTAMHAMYLRIGQVKSGVLETDGAIDAGEAVRKEFKKSSSASPRGN